MLIPIPVGAAAMEEGVVYPPAPTTSLVAGEEQMWSRKDPLRSLFTASACALGSFAPFFLLVELSGKGSLFSPMYSLSRIIWGLT